MRMRKNAAARQQPWFDGWQRLVANRHASLDWKPNPQPAIYRGRNPEHAENYATLFNDAAAAYALALRWKITGDDAYAQHAIDVLNAWSRTLTMIGGSSDKFLASGIYGYQLANAGEILRTSQLWRADDFQRFQSMMAGVFYPMNHDFLVRHNGAKIDHYWANWDLANMASMLAIGVLTDRHDIYAEAVDYFRHGAGNGSIEHVVWKLYPDGLGQVQESGRDQGHTMLDIALLGAFCQMAWSQGTISTDMTTTGSCAERNTPPDTTSGKTCLTRNTRTATSRNPSFRRIRVVMGVRSGRSSTTTTSCSKGSPRRTSRLLPARSRRKAAVATTVPTAAASINWDMGH